MAVASYFDLGGSARRACAFICPILGMSCLLYLLRGIYPSSPSLHTQPLRLTCYASFPSAGCDEKLLLCTNEGSEYVVAVLFPELPMRCTNSSEGNQTFSWE